MLRLSDLESFLLNDNKYYVNYTGEQKREPMAPFYCLNMSSGLLEKSAHLKHQVILTSARVDITQ